MIVRDRAISGRKTGTVPLASSVQGPDAATLAAAALIAPRLSVNAERGRSLNSALRIRWRTRKLMSDSPEDSQPGTESSRTGVSRETPVRQPHGLGT
jgi:hypothetical protein